MTFCISLQIRSLCFNKEFREIAALSLNGYIHVFNAETFKQKLSRKLPNCQDNVSIAYHSNGFYAIGCRSYTILLDTRTLQVFEKNMRMNVHPYFRSIMLRVDFFLARRVYYFCFIL